MAIESISLMRVNGSPASESESTPHSRSQLRNIVVCLDGSALSEEILPVAASWAASAGLTLRLLHVTSPFMTGAGGREELGLPGGINPESYLRQLFDKLDNSKLDLRFQVIHSPYIARAIAEYAGSIPGAVVALTTHGRTGLRRLAMGSVAMKIVQECSSPVLVLRPQRLPIHGNWDETAEEVKLHAAS